MKTSGFRWNNKTSEAATMLAQGYTVAEVAEKFGIAERTIYRWKNDVEFAAEVDRLSVMVDLAGRAERLRLAQRVIRRMEERTSRDLLDWLRFVQSETDGAKLDGGFIEQLAALLATGAQPTVDTAAEGAGATGSDDDAGDATPDADGASDPA
jgi:transposase-like protein